MLSLLFLDMIFETKYDIYPVFILILPLGCWSILPLSCWSILILPLGCWSILPSTAWSQTVV